MEDPEELHQQRLLEFERRVQENNLWAGISSERPDVLDNDVFEAINHLNEEEDTLVELIDSLALTESDALAHLNTESGLVEDKDWAPYPSKLVFLLDAIDNMPRLRVSSGLMAAILRQTKGVETVHTQSPKGNLFSFNSPVDVITNDWTNPLIRGHIQKYPVISRTGTISEIWHGEKWRHTLDRHALSPMYDGGDRHYYIDEPARIDTGELVIPIRWLEDEEGKVWFDTWKVTHNENNFATIVNDEKEIVLLQVDVLREDMLDLVDKGLMPSWSERTIAAGHPTRMPNPDRALAEGDPLYTSFVDVFRDDVSGNVSKSWNKHWNIYMESCNDNRTITSFPLPLWPQSPSNSRLSTHAKPAKFWDPLTECFTRLKIQCNCEPGDNPAQSEASGHMGVGSNLLCRKCMVGGTKKDKQSNNGFDQLFSPGEPWTAEGTLKEVKAQVRLACRGVAVAVKDRQTETGVKDTYTQSWIEKLLEWSTEQKKHSDGRSLDEIEAELMEFVEAHHNEIYNPFLTLKYNDVARDTPVEILHTILLGIVKYSWHPTHTGWKDAQKMLFSARLQATDTRGLSVPAIHAGYIMQYANSLVGRQLKILVQTNAFHVHNLVSADQYRMIKATGILAALLRVPEIRNMTEYLEDVHIAVSNVLDCAAQLDPSKIIVKMKYHLLVHLVDDIKRFGPIVGVATEGYESFNLVFRYCSIMSNRLLPSRDIAYQLARQETFQHTISGGWYQDKDGTWRQPGASLRQYVDGSELLKQVHHLTPTGAESTTKQAGHTVLVSLKPAGQDEPPPVRTAVPIRETMAGNAIASSASTQNLPRNLKWFKCKSIIISSGDECQVGSWVFAQRKAGEGGESEVFTGRIVEILREASEHRGARSFAVVELFQVLHDLHPVYDMPVLTKRFGEMSRFSVTAQDILFDYNTQHDCHTGKCTNHGEKAMMQERLDSGRKEKYVEHANLDRFIINTHAFHNAHQLRAVSGLGTRLRPKLLYANRREHHDGGASMLRAKKAAADTEKAKAKQDAAKLAAHASTSTETQGKKRRRKDTAPSSAAHSGGNTPSDIPSTLLSGGPSEPAPMEED